MADELQISGQCTHHHYRNDLDCVTAWLVLRCSSHYFGVSDFDFSVYQCIILLIASIPHFYFTSLVLHCSIPYFRVLDFHFSYFCCIYSLDLFSFSLIFLIFIASYFYCFIFRFLAYHSIDCFIFLHSYFISLIIYSF
jgi:hypothetical protein